MSAIDFCQTGRRVVGRSWVHVMVCSALGLSVSVLPAAVFAQDGPDRSAALGRAFAAAGLAVLELHHDRAGLEAVFLDLLDREAGTA